MTVSNPGFLLSIQSRDSAFFGFFPDVSAVLTLGGFWIFELSDIRSWKNEHETESTPKNSITTRNNGFKNTSFFLLWIVLGQPYLNFFEIVIQM
jgi:hypothetical protein